MDKNIFDIVEPAYEPLSEQDELKILAAVTAKTGGADGMVGVDASDSAGAANGTAEAGLTASGVSDGTVGAGVAMTDANVVDGLGAGSGYVASGEASRERRETPRRRAGSAKSATRGARGRHGRRIAVIAIAAVLAFGAVAFASTAIDPNSPLLAIFNMNGEELNEQKAQLIQSSGTLIGKTVEKNGVKIHVKEAIGDKDIVHLLIDVTLPEDVVEPGAQYRFDRMDLNEVTSLLTKSSGMAYSYSPFNDELSEDGTFTMIISATPFNGAQGKTLTLDLHDLQRAPGTDVADENVLNKDGGDSDGEISSGAGEASESGTSSLSSGETHDVIEGFEIKSDDDGNFIESRITTDEDGNIIDYVSGPAVDGEVDGFIDMNSGEYDSFKTIIEGDWHVKFELDYVDNSVGLNVNEEFNIDGIPSRLTDVRISPLSLSYTIDTGNSMNVDASSDSEVLNELEASSDVLNKFGGLPVILKMKDGEEIDVTEMSGASMGEGAKYTINKQFKLVIDPKQVESIMFGDQEVKL
jgi:hypothetical protein